MRIVLPLLFISALTFGQNDFSINFPNSNSGVNVGNSDLFDIYDSPTLQKTFMFWAKNLDNTQFRTNMMIKSTCNSSNCNDYHFFLTDPTNEGIVWGMGTVVSSNCNHNIEPIVLDNDWHHYAMTLSGITANSGVKTVYYDGQIVNQCSYNDNAPVNDDSLYFGYYSGTFQVDIHSVDFMDDISIWDTVLTETEINDYMVCPPTGTEAGIVGFWDFEEGTGTTTADQTINGNDGALFYGATFSQDVPPYACTASMSELSKGKKELIKVVDLLGREVQPEPNKVLIYVYSDGTIERKIQIK